MSYETYKNYLKACIASNKKMSDACLKISEIVKELPYMLIDEEIIHDADTYKEKAEFYDYMYVAFSESLAFFMDAQKKQNVE